MTRAMRYGIERTGTSYAELGNVVKLRISSSIVLRLSLLDSMDTRSPRAHNLK